MKYALLAIPILFGAYVGWKLFHPRDEGDRLPMTPERKRLLLLAERKQNEYSEMLGI